MRYCIVPPELAPELLEELEALFANDAGVTVIAERRRGVRRRRGDRRGQAGRAPQGRERRRITNPDGRRVADRRLPAVELDLPPLPQRARALTDRIRFVEPIPLPSRHVEDIRAARLVTRVQAGELDRVADLYLGHLDSVYGFLRSSLREHEAEDATQQVFLRMMEALPRYEFREVPFRAWLLRIARNHALDRIRAGKRQVLCEPAVLSRRRERCAGVGEGDRLDLDPENLAGVSDERLARLLERLPPRQRQVLILRYALDLTPAEIAEAMELRRDHVYQLAHRGLESLRISLTARGSAGDHRTARPRAAVRTGASNPNRA